MRLRLAQLDPEAAADGQVPVYNETSGEFEPAVPSVPDHALFSITRGTEPYFENRGSTYVLAADIPFCGTSVCTPDTIQVIAWATAGQSTYVRVYDVTNAQQIAEASTTSTTKALLDLGTLANLPTGPAIFEIQIRSTANTNAWISAFEMY